MPDITLRQLRYFSTLSGVLQYREAARQLGISQPSLSQQIALLEEAVGARLVERRRSGLILTPAGRDVTQRAERILGEVHALKEAARPAGDTLTGTLRLGASPTVGPYLLPRVLRHLHQEHPDLRLVIRDGTPRALLEDLLAGRHDLILAQLPLPEDEVRVRPLFREDLRLAVARDHPIARAERVTASDLVGEDMLALSASYGLHRQMMSLAAEAGAVLRADFEGTSLDAVRQMVALGMGVSILPALYVWSEVARRDADVVCVPLRPAATREVGLAWRIGSGTPPAYRRLADVIRARIDADFSDLVTVLG
ncbi:MAG: LysR substrate-binding domain-containing protein [Pseudomonadota bacterium]